MKFAKYWFPVLLYSGIIYFLSAQPNLKVPHAEIGFDKFAHLLEYGPFGFLITRAVKNYRPKWSLVAIGSLVMLLLLAHGLADEFHQGFVIGRDCNIFDALADLGGGALGGWFYLKEVSRKIKRTRRLKT